MSGIFEARQGRELCFPEVEPWEQPVEGATLLDWIAEVCRRYLALTPGAAEAMALWVVHAHAHDCFGVSPLLVFRSPAPRCGKTTALRVVGRLVPRALNLANVTTSAAFRAVEKFRPTLLIDEADAFMRDNEELRGLLNSGHERENAVVVRTVGQSFEVRLFSAWAPKAIASIGALAATLEDRSIAIIMRRRKPDEKIARLRLDQHVVEDLLRRKIVRWVVDNKPALREADPDLPESLDDRGADNWRPLLAIAETAGGDWPRLARQAAILLSEGRQDETGAREQLLADIRTVWGAERGETFASADVVGALIDLKDRPWAEWSRGRPLSQSGLARLLQGFGIRSGNVRVAGAVLRGYKRADFEDAWGRYVAPGDGAVAASVAGQNGASATLFPAPGLDCSGVALSTPVETERGDAWESET